MSEREIDCENARHEISSALSGKKTENLNIQVIQHLAHCEPCRCYETDAKTILHELGRLDLYQCPDELAMASTRAAISNGIHPAKKLNSQRTSILEYIAAAAAVTVACVAVWRWNGMPNISPVVPAPQTLADEPQDAAIPDDAVIFLTSDPYRMTVTEAEKTHLAKFEAKISLDLDNKTIVEVLEALSTKCAIPISVSNDFKDKTGNNIVSLRVIDSPARDVLEIITNKFNGAYDINANGINFSTPQNRLFNAILEVYSVEGLSFNASRLAQILSGHVFKREFSSTQVSLESTSTKGKDALVVMQSAEIQAMIRSVLIQLNKHKNARSYKFQRPVPVLNANAKATLDEKRIVFDFVSTPLKDAIAKVSVDTGIPMILLTSDNPVEVNLRVTDMPAATAIDWIAQLSNVQRVNFTSSVAFTNLPNKPELKYVIYDLAQYFNVPTEDDTNGIVNMIRHRVRPEEWASGSARTIERIDSTRVGVMQTDEIHALVEQLFLNMGPRRIEAFIKTLTDTGAVLNVGTVDGVQRGDVFQIVRDDKKFANVTVTSVEYDTATINLPEHKILKVGDNARRIRVGAK
jgi:hypothetical protein